MRVAASAGTSSMSDRFFLDTNIFVYSFHQTAPAKSQKAAELIRKALATQKGIISVQVVQEFFNVALRRFAQPMQPAEAEQYLATVFRPLLGIHSSEALYAEALRLQSQSSISWYDAIIVSAALQAQCDVLFSEDLQHGQRFGSLRIANPFL
jgi:predicted nucleic acid-binding protein